MAHLVSLGGRAFYVSDRIRITDRDRRFVNERDADKPCGLCGLPIEPGEETHLHHKAWAEGGNPSTPDNLVRVHATCNLGVGTRGMDVAMALASAMSTTWREARRRKVEAEAELGPARKILGGRLV